MSLRRKIQLSGKFGQVKYEILTETGKLIKTRCGQVIGKRENSRSYIRNKVIMIIEDCEKYGNSNN